MRPHILRALSLPAAAVAVLALGVPGASTAGVAAAAPGPVATPAHPATAYLVNYFQGTVTPVNTATNKALKAIPVGGLPFAIAITPDGKTVYVSSPGSGVTPVSTATSKAGKTIDVGGAITPAPRDTTTVPSGFQPAAASFWSPGRGVVLGAVGCVRLPCRARLVITSDNGEHWQFLTTPDLQLGKAGRTVSGVLFASRQDGWLYGGAGLWFTNNGGSRWRQLALPGSVTAMAASAGTAYAVVEPHLSAPEELFRSPAGRAAWVRAGQMTAASATLAVSGRAAWFASGAGFTAPATYLWATTDGTHWHRYPFSCPKGYGLASIAAASTSRVLFLCSGSGFADGSGKEILASADGGRTTRLAGHAPAEGDLAGFAVPPDRPQVITLAAVSGLSLLYTSANGGKTWTITVVGNSEPLSSLAYVNRTIGWVVLGTPGPNGTHGLLRTTNAGRTWHKINF